MSFDSEVGLFYNYFRDYNPKTGRYVESDPIGLKGGMNTYGYVEGNALGAVDPDGLQAALCVQYRFGCGGADFTKLGGGWGAGGGGLGLGAAANSGLNPADASDNAPAKQCDDKPDDCGPLTRVQAYALAQKIAQVPRKEREHYGFDSINNSSRGKNCAAIQAAGGTYAGYGCSWNKSEIVDHPDGHDDDNAGHHKCPHLHVYGWKNETLAIIQYRRN